MITKLQAAYDIAKVDEDEARRKIEERERHPSSIVGPKGHT